MKEIGKKLVRLLGMPPREIAARTAEQWSGWKEWVVSTTSGNARGVPGVALDAPKASAIFERFLSRPFYFSESAADRVTLVQKFREFFPGRVEGIVEDAEKICAGSPRLFGKPVTFSKGKIDWHLDWKTGGHFPTTFYRRIGEKSAPPDADWKRVWETNRQQFLVTLGKAYFLTRQQRYAERAVELIESWIAANPPYRGVNWKESLEIGLRILSWTWTLRLLAGADALAGGALERILASLAIQRDHLSRHLSTYSSPNTHVLGEALGMLVVGLAFPDLGRDPTTASRALGILESELGSQVARDGSHREQAAYYHCYALEMYLLATQFCKLNGIGVSPRWTERVEKMADFLLAIVRPDGWLARFGDDDGGRALRLSEEDYYRPRSLLAIAAILFDRGEFKRLAGELPEEVFWVFGPEGVHRYLGLKETEPAQRTFWFGDAHLAILRTGWGPNEAWICCQGQPMGFITAGHSHAGLLSFELVLDGKPVLVDPGTYTYRASDPWREHFRRMEAHNAVQPDRRHWYTSVGPFRWSRSDQVQPIPPTEGRHDVSRLGYQVKSPNGEVLSHLRTLAAESAKAVTIHDRFEGAGKHQLTFWLHFAPGCRLRTIDQKKIEIRSDPGVVELAFEGFGDIHWDVWEGNDNPPAGWVSPRYDEKVPAPTLCLREEVEFPAERRFSLRIVPGSESGISPGALPARNQVAPGKE